MHKDMPTADSITGQPCPICHKNAVTLVEREVEVPYFGSMYLFSMDCGECKYHKSDVEAKESKDPSRYTIEVSGENDLNIRVVKSSEATVKIPHIGSIEPGSASNGYVTNVEGILNRMKYMIEKVRDDAEGLPEKKKAKNLLKKLQNVMWGRDKLKIIIEDPTGNSAIISEKAEVKRMK